jgi:hypothetical protein
MVRSSRSPSTAGFVRLRPVFDGFSLIESEFDRLTSATRPGAKAVSAGMTCAAHSAFLAGVRLAVSGQVRESYALTRSMVEWSLYAVVALRITGTDELWLRREESPAARGQMLSAFSLPRLLQSAAEVDTESSSILGEVYEFAIAYGAHPNERALSQNSRFAEADGELRLNVDYLSRGDSPAFLAAIAVLSCASVESTSLLATAWAVDLDAPDEIPELRQFRARSREAYRRLVRRRTDGRTSR